MVVRRLVMAGVLMSLCVVGAQIKVLGSIAFDSFPAFLGGLLLGPNIGAALGIFGHLLSAAIVGFPLSGAVHGITAVMMGISVWIYSKTIAYVCHRGRRRWLAYVLGSVLAYVMINIVALVILYPWLKGFVFIIFWPLTLANIANLLLAALVYEALPSGYKMRSK